MSATFATSDAHGHLAELTAALQRAGLLDEESRWSGGSRGCGSSATSSTAVPTGSA